MQKEIILSIKQSIASGEYKSGDRLPSEAQLIEKFGVSRSVLRESLSVLKADGFIESKRGRNGGFIALPPSFDPVIGRLMDLLLAGAVTLRQAAEMRLKLEIDALKEGMERISKDDITRLYELDEWMRASKNPIEHTRLNAEFHGYIGALSGNKLQGIFLDLLLQFVGRAAEIYAEDIIQLHSYDEHQPVIENIEYGDIDKACFYLEIHILNALDRLERAEKKRLTKEIHASFSRTETISSIGGFIKDRS